MLKNQNILVCDFFCQFRLSSTRLTEIARDIAATFIGEDEKVFYRGCVNGHNARGSLHTALDTLKRNRRKNRILEVPGKKEAEDYIQSGMLNIL